MSEVEKGSLRKGRSRPSRVCLLPGEEPQSPLQGTGPSLGQANIDNMMTLMGQQNKILVQCMNEAR